jgi:A/G-specific adenine glycosylase
LAEDLLPSTDKMIAYTQGLMDLGSTLCIRSRPLCLLCPVQRDCYAFKHHAQTQLPSKKIKKIIPSRQTIMLLIHCDQHILLQKRPDRGIWPNLWSFPEVATFTEIDDYCLNTLNMATITKQRSLSPLQHAFTHYRLTITPQPISTDHTPFISDDRGWFTFAETDKLGIPAPVRQLIATLQNQLFGPTHPNLIKS